VNLVDDLLRRSHEVPDRVGLYFEDGREWTFREWDEQSGRYAAALRDLGASEGDRVGLFVPNSPELAFLLYAAWRIGAVAVPMSSLYNADELTASIDKTLPKVVVGHASLGAPFMGADVQGATRSVVGGSLDGCVDLDDAASRVEPLEGCVTEPEDAVILFTGGTTGQPKAAVMQHRGVLQTVSTMVQASKAGAEGPYPAASETTPPNLIAWPLFHAGGQQPLLVALHAGRSVVLVRRFSVPVLAEMVARHRLDNVFLAPTMIYDVVASPDDIDLSSLRSVLSAGQRLDPDLQRRFELRFGVPILQTYGSTETGHVAGWTGADLKAGRWRPGAVGRLYPGVDVEVRDDDGAVLPPGSPGELWVRSKVTRGYADGQGGDLIDDAGWVRSGDVGTVDDDGVLTLVGRRREMIKTGGFQIWPGEVEDVLREHPQVADVAVVGVPDDRMGEIPKAFVVPAGGSVSDPAAVADAIVAFARDRLAHFKAPRAIEFIEELPRTEAGKVARGELVARAEPSSPP
jgi:long-chain acyl-CoA synthetase